ALALLSWVLFPSSADQAARRWARSSGRSPVPAQNWRIARSSCCRSLVSAVCWPGVWSSYAGTYATIASSCSVAVFASPLGPGRDRTRALHRAIGAAVPDPGGGAQRAGGPGQDGGIGDRFWRL